MNAGTMPGQPVQWLFLAAVVAMLGLLRWSRRFFWVFSILVLPGTFAHETCHLAVGAMLNGRPAGLNLLPRRTGNGWEMGSASFSHLTWYNAFFVGMAPLLLLPAAYLLLRWRLDLRPVFGWREALSIYLIANLVYAALPSWQDLRIAARSPVGWLLLAAGLAWAWRAWQSPPAGPRPGPGMTTVVRAWPVAMRQVPTPPATAPCLRGSRA
jgi:hypothetical protein